MTFKRLQRVLVANRGEIAGRVIRTCFDTGRESVLAASDADMASLPARLADRVVCIGPSTPTQSYLRPELLIAAAIKSGCDAIHPGYGFLSENPQLAMMCAQHGLVFIGPSPDCLSRAGDKASARTLAGEAGVPTVPGSPPTRSTAEAMAMAGEIGFPLLLKATAGGGGRGMHLVTSPQDLYEAFELAAKEAEASFGDGTLYLERNISNGRHIEVQILADQFGSVVHLGERDCSYQRRYQKVIEESPAPALPPPVRDALCDDALRLMRMLGYVGAGTVEFLVDTDSGAHFFLETNARLQVEHPVTEAVTGLDLVQLQLHIAAGQRLPFTQEEITVSGHAIECRVNAEDPARSFMPSPGRIGSWIWPASDRLRIDTHCFPGYQIPPFYDALLAKVIARGESRTAAADVLSRTLSAAQVDGVSTNVPLLRALVRHDDFRRGGCTTDWLEREFLPGYAG